MVPFSTCAFAVGGTDVVEACLDRVTDWRVHRLELNRRRRIGSRGLVAGKVRRWDDRRKRRRMMRLDLRPLARGTEGCGCLE